MIDQDYVHRTKHLFEVALGKKQAHLAVTRATLANVYTGEFLENQTICVWDRWIAYVGPKPGESIGPETEIVDAQDKTVIPGFIDGHTHMSDRYTAAPFLKHVIPGGTTAIVTETVEPYAVGGYEGVTDFMNSLADQPIHFFGTVAPSASISENFPPVALENLNRLLTRPDIVGLGESFWQSVLKDPDRLLPVFQTVLAMGKLLEGHSAGASGSKLNAYAAANVTSCHEPINAREALERLRLGFYVMVREGSIRRDLEEILTLGEETSDLRRMILVTDGVSPKDLLEKGYMEFVVQKAIDSGLSPMSAIQMATINPATHFNLDHIIGGLAPGRYADMAILPDISRIQPELVIGQGRIMARHGQCTVTPREHRFQEANLDSVHLPADMTAADFRIPTDPALEQASVRVIDMITDLVTAEARIDLPVLDGEISSDLSQDVVKIAAINRCNNPGQKYVGLIRGFGIKAGALAGSTGWDLADIVVLGASEEDMAAAVNRIRDLKGGVVVCDQDRVVAELPLPIMGLMTDISIPDLARRLDSINTALRELGVTFRDPLLALSALTSAAIPFLRICEQGLVNLKSGPCSLIVSDLH
ncbi:MAG: adenine deaminase C-terminal domain-containing protein [Desulfovermiculus sp.]|nr:adenine deaminase C-terminal domain-containing protein [Desulfovermiculus sp.]